MKIRCTSCRKTMSWDTTQGYPRFCALCGYDFGPDREDDDIVMPFVRASQISKTHDTLYRQMETASEQRVADAAAITGATASEMSHLKITDLRSTKHPGSIAAPPLPANLQNMGGFQSTGNEWAGAVKSGPYPNAGAHELNRVQRLIGKR